MLLLVVHLLLIAATAVFLLSHFSLKGRVGYALAGFGLMAGQIVLIAEILSAFTLLTANAFWIVEIVVFLTGLTAWFITGRKKLLAPFRRGVWQSFISDLKGDKALTALVIGLLLCLLAMGIFAWAKMDDFGDTRAYHYPRIALWIQNQTLYFTPEEAAHILDERIVGTEPISDILYLWVFLTTRSMRTLNIVEWAAVIPLVIAIYGLAYDLVKKRRPAILAALVYLSFETVSWNMIHANAVLTSAAFILSGLYFLKVLDDDRRPQWMLFACLHLALGVGAKATTYYLAPFLAVILAVLSIRGVKSRGWNFLLLFVAFGFASLLVFAFPNYLQNILIYGGPVALVAARESSPVTRTAAEFVSCLGANLPRLAYLGLQPDPLPAFLEAPAFSAWASLGERLGLGSAGCTRSNPLTVDWYGNNLLSVVFLIGGMFASFRAARRDDKTWRLLLWMLWGGFFITFSFFMSFHEPHYRYFAIPAAIFCVLIVDLLASLAERRRLWLAFLAFTLYAGVFFTIDSYRENFRDFSAFKAELRNDDREGYALDSYAPSGSEILAFFGGKFTTDIMLFGDDAGRQMSFATCDNLYSELRDGEFDFFLNVYYEQSSHLDECRQQLSASEAESIARILEREYVLIYRGLHYNEPIEIYQPVADASDEVLYPASFPPNDARISVHPSYQGLIGAGPVYINTGSIGAGKRIDFSLRTRESGLVVPIAIEFTGEICPADSILDLKQTDASGQLVAELDIPVRQIGEGVYDSFFSVILREGINHFSIADSECDPPVGFPLYFSRISVAPDISGPGVRVQEGGWYGLEFTPEGQPYRWVNDDAAFTLTRDEPGEVILMLGAQSGPGHAGEPFLLEVWNEEGAVLGTAVVTGQWSEMSIPLTLPAGEHLLTLHSEGGGLPAENDGRILNFLVTGMTLSQPPGE